MTRLASPRLQIGLTRAFAWAGVAAFCATTEGYLLALLVAAGRKRPVACPEGGPFRLTVLVPAHNESNTIGRCIRSLRHEHVHVVVIAHNCSDDTAAVAAAAGATVVTFDCRDANTKAGAISFGLRHSSCQENDAIAVVDADCRASVNFYDAIRSRMVGGERACQVDNRVENPTDNTLTAVRSAAFTLNHHTRGRGKEALGLSAGIFGTGFAVSKDVALSVPWPEDSLAEDRLYHLALAERQIRVAFVPEAFVESSAVGTSQLAYAQQRRWESSQRACISKSVKVISLGIRRRDGVMVLAGIDVLVPGQSMLILLNCLAFWLGYKDPRLRSISAGLAAGQVVYVGCGLRIAGAPRAVVRSLVGAPLLISYKVRGLPRRIGPLDSIWVRARG